MNYIRHLHAFYHYVKRDDRLSATHVSLYMAIFQYWNYNRFQNPFPIERDELMSLSKIGSKNTYHKCMKELHNFNYIIYHSGIKKYQNVRVTMVRLAIKTEEKGLKQLDLFSTGSDEPGDPETGFGNEPDLPENPAPGLAHTEANLNAPACIKNDTHISTGIDTHTSTTFDTHTCTDIDTPSCTGFDTHTCTDFGTTCVPLLGHNNIKHKHLKHCVFKTTTHTSKKIFEKNIKIQNAINQIAACPASNSPQIRDTRHRQNRVLPAAQNALPPGHSQTVTLPLVEIYFLQNSFPITEAKKFFYYNQGRGWKFSENFPVRDWEALAQKWMLNKLTPKIVQHDKSGNTQNQHTDPSPGKDYSEPL